MTGVDAPSGYTQRATPSVESTASTVPLGLPRRPWLPPVLRRVWRAVGVLQIGVDPDRAVVVHGVTPALYQLIGLLDGRRTTSEVIALAVAAGATRESAGRLLESLGAAGYLVELDRTITAPGAAAHPEDVPHLLSDLSTRALRHPGLAPADILARRGRAGVVVHGGRRVGTAFAAMLGAAGVGRVSVVDQGVVDRTEILPGGYVVSDVGRSRVGAAHAAVLRAAPRTTTTPLDSHARPDLVVVTEPWPEPGERDRLLDLTRTPSLHTTAREGRAVIGPFVVPGVTSCLRCQHLHRLDRDPGWSAVIAQLRVGPPEAGGSDALCLLAASFAVTQALDWIDTRRPPTTADTTVEVTASDLVLVHRRWSRHPACACGRGGAASLGL